MGTRRVAGVTEANEGQAPALGSRSLRVAVVACAVVVAIAGASAQPLDREIVLGGDHEYGACGVLGQVAGLDPRGDGFLAVRTGPGTRHREIDRIYNGQMVWICADSGPWYGVIYARGTIECGVSDPWPVRAPYTGPCRRGWVHSNWVVQVAG